MSTLTWVVAGVAAYWVVATVLKRQGVFPEFMSVQGPLLTVHTQRGKILLDRLAQRRRFWRAWSNVGIGIALVVMALSFLFLLLTGVLSALNPPEESTQVTEPKNVLVIPGYNDFLPLSVAPEIMLGLLVGLVVHEGGHGLLCRVEDIEIDSMGVALFALIPIGAFVEPDPDSQATANRGGRTRMFAAGVTNNFAITVLVFLLLFGPIAGSIGVAGGAAVSAAVPGSGASAADIGSGDRITAIEDAPVESNGDLSAVLENTTGRNVTVEIDGQETRTVQRSVVVIQALEDGPANVSVESTITVVNGTPVNTSAEFEGALETREVVGVRLTRSDGTTANRTFPAGAAVRAQPGGALAAAGAPDDRLLVVVAVNGTRTVDGEALQNALDDRASGSKLQITAYVDGQRRQYTATLAGAPGEDGTLGVRIFRGVSGLVLDDFGVQLYAAGPYLAALGGEGNLEQSPLVSADSTVGTLTESFIGRTLLVLLLPLASIILGFRDNFPGFTGDNLNFYEAQGVLEPLDGGVFLLANIMFWVGWINLNLGFFNCIPAFPLDGGHILRTGTESIVSRLPVQDSYTATKVVTVSIGLAMGVSLLLMIAVPQLA